MGDGCRAPRGYPHPSYLSPHPFAVRAVLFFLLLFPLAVPSVRADVLARVVSVHDGDTLTVVIDERQVKVRLTDIDAPELRQPFGTKSKQSLSELCFGKTAALEVRRQDRYKPALAQVICGGRDANAEQVRRGLAWTYVRYARSDSQLHAIQAAAQTAHRGLWVDPAPVAPWDWRKYDRP